ncbi:MAG: class I SAM-dependent methyltransferase [Promethearchaeota archaeon]
MPELSDVSYKKHIMKLYNEPSYVKTYDRRYNTIQLAKYMTVLPSLTNNTGWILDVGIGTGLFLKKVVRQWALIVGIDLSLNMLRLAKKRAKNYINVELILADADHLPFKENTFPTITAFTILQNMPDLSKTLTEIIRVSEGVVAITVLKRKIDEAALQKLLQRLGVKEFEVIETESEDIFAVYYVN